MTILLKLTIAEAGSGPFDIYINRNVAPYVREKINTLPVPKATLVAGYVLDVPQDTTSAEIVSLGGCVSSTYVPLSLTTEEHCINATVTNDRNINLIFQATIDFTAIAAGRTVNPAQSNATLIRYLSPYVPEYQTFDPILLSFTFNSSTIATLNATYPVQFEVADATTIFGHLLY